MMTHLLLRNGSAKPPFKQEEGNVEDMYRFSKARRLDRRCCAPCCCLGFHGARNRDFAVRDFPFIYKKIMSLELTSDQKETILMRFSNIMDKVKRKYGVFFLFHTCTRSSLIIGNILVPSLLSIEAMFYENKDVRLVVFWGVWALSLVIALISSFVTFFNTQKKYNLYNQFNTMIQREIFAYIELTGPYKILSEHLDLLKPKNPPISCAVHDDGDGGNTFILEDYNDNDGASIPLVQATSTPFVLGDNENPSASLDDEEGLTQDLPADEDADPNPAGPDLIDEERDVRPAGGFPPLPESKFSGPSKVLPVDRRSSRSSGTVWDEDPAYRREDSAADCESGQSVEPPEDLFIDNEVTKYSVEDVPFIIRKGHMFHYSLFLENLEKLYRRLTNSNIDINHDDLTSGKSSKNTLTDQKKE